MSTTYKPGKADHQEAAKAEAFILSRNPNKALQEMMETIDALRSVYEEETKALQEADTKRFTTLLNRKLEIAHNYQAGAAQMLERREEFKKTDPELRRKLLQAHENFTTLSSNNLDALERSKKAVQRLGDRIMSVARDAVRKESVTYGASGDLGSSQRPVSIGLNESA